MRNILPKASQLTAEACGSSDQSLNTFSRVSEGLPLGQWVNQQIEQGNFSRAEKVVADLLSDLENKNANSKSILHCKLAMLEIGLKSGKPLEDASIYQSVVKAARSPEDYSGGLGLRLLTYAVVYGARFGTSNPAFAQEANELVAPLYFASKILPADSELRERTLSKLLGACTDLVHCHDSDVRTLSYIAKGSFEALGENRSPVITIRYGAMLKALYDHDVRMTAQRGVSSAEELTKMCQNLTTAIDLCDELLPSSEQLLTDWELAAQELQLQCFLKLDKRVDAERAYTRLFESLEHEVNDTIPNRVRLKTRCERYQRALNL